MKKVLMSVAERFPQLYIKPAEGNSQTELYRGIVRKGNRYQGDLEHFVGSEEDSFTVEHTPAGDVEVLFLKNRKDFECCCQIMAYRCEPKEIPNTMGAICISGINDWSKIHSHMEAYKDCGGTDEKAEFARFTSDTKNYKTYLILLSEGPYSAFPAKEAGYSEVEWINLSTQIRKYHELTHFVCRNLYPEMKYPVWDEILADCMGMHFALGEYKLELAMAILGIKAGVYVKGRLENYLSNEPDEQLIKDTVYLMEWLDARCKELCEEGHSGFDLISNIEEAVDKSKLF